MRVTSDAHENCKDHPWREFRGQQREEAGLSKLAVETAGKARSRDHRRSGISRERNSSPQNIVVQRLAIAEKDLGRAFYFRKQNSQNTMV